MRSNISNQQQFQDQLNRENQQFNIENIDNSFNNNILGDLNASFFNDYNEKEELSRLISKQDPNTVGYNEGLEIKTESINYDQYKRQIVCYYYVNYLHFNNQKGVLVEIICKNSIDYIFTKESEIIKAKEKLNNQSRVLNKKSNANIIEELDIQIKKYKSDQDEKIQLILLKRIISSIYQDAELKLLNIVKEDEFKQDQKIQNGYQVLKSIFQDNLRQNDIIFSDSQEKCKQGSIFLCILQTSIPYNNIKRVIYIGQTQKRVLDYAEDLSNKQKKRIKFYPLIWLEIPQQKPSQSNLDEFMIKYLQKECSKNQVYDLQDIQNKYFLLDNDLMQKIIKVMQTPMYEVNINSDINSSISRISGLQQLNDTRLFSNIQDQFQIIKSLNGENDNLIQNNELKNTQNSQQIQDIYIQINQENNLFSLNQNNQIQHNLSNGQIKYIECHSGQEIGQQDRLIEKQVQSSNQQEYSLIQSQIFDPQQQQLQDQKKIQQLDTQEDISQLIIQMENINALQQKLQNFEIKFQSEFEDIMNSS